jgi:3-hydroxyacyl-[acyl-carrier-protein] dehydratase
VKPVHSQRIAPDHPAFAGHFPGTPILPGALLLDEALSALAAALDLDLCQWQITAAKFLEPVRPGDVITVEHAPSADSIRFVVRVADREALAGMLARRSAHDA